MRCEQHKKYLAIMPPRVGCITCWKLYSVSLQGRLNGVNEKLQELMIQEILDESNNSRK